MNVSSINSFGTMGTGAMGVCACPDSEEQRIMKKLIALGRIPTGNKAFDKETLFRIELEQVKQEICGNPNATVSIGKYLTITENLIEEIMMKLKDRKDDDKTGAFKNENIMNKNQGAEILGDYNKYLIKNKKSKYSHT